MTTTMESPYATGPARAEIRWAMTAAGKEMQALQASDLAMREDFHRLGPLATVARARTSQAVLAAEGR